MRHTQYFQIDLRNKVERTIDTEEKEFFKSEFETEIDSIISNITLGKYDLNKLTLDILEELKDRLEFKSREESNSNDVVEKDFFEVMSKLKNGFSIKDDFELKSLFKMNSEKIKEFLKLDSVDSQASIITLRFNASDGISYGSSLLIFAPYIRECKIEFPFKISSEIVKFSFFLILGYFLSGKVNYKF